MTTCELKWLQGLLLDIHVNQVDIFNWVVHQFLGRPRSKKIFLNHCLKQIQGLLLDLRVNHSAPVRLTVAVKQLCIFLSTQCSMNVSSTFYHFVFYVVYSGIIRPAFVPTGSQLDDIFTKALSGHQFEYLLRKLGIHNLHAPT